jgi:hypothetical protein
VPKGAEALGAFNLLANRALVPRLAPRPDLLQAYVALLWILPYNGLT